MLFLAQCEPITAPLPAGAVAFTPPSVYADWWRITEGCSARTGDYSAVSWYIVPDVSNVPGDDPDVAGYWYAAGDRIVLAGASEWDGTLVRHEMLHALLRSGGHPRNEFLGACRNIVVCVKACIADGGPAPTPDPLAVAVSPARLDIAVHVTPIPPIDTADGGYFMMIVTARNPLTTPVIVQLPASSDAGPPVSFSYRVTSTIAGEAGQSYDMRADVPEDSSFAAGEVKEFIFDFHIVPNAATFFELSPGTYVFAGGYGRVWAASQPTITISP